MQIRVAGIENDSITDGAGLRFALFVQGCTRNCKGCHNPQALPLDGGTVMDTDEILAMIDKNPLLDGVTLSGGEPFLQSASLADLAKAIKERKLHLAIYTGNTYEDIILSNDLKSIELLKQADILVDGEFVESLRSLELNFRGSSNQRVIDVQKSLKSNKVITTDWVIEQR